MAFATTLTAVPQWTFLGGSQAPNSMGNYPAAIGEGGKQYGPGARGTLVEMFGVFLWFRSN